MIRWNTVKVKLDDEEFTYKEFTETFKLRGWEVLRRWLNRGTAPKILFEFYEEVIIEVDGENYSLKPYYRFTKTDNILQKHLYKRFRRSHLPAYYIVYQVEGFPISWIMQRGGTKEEALKRYTTRTDMTVVKILGVFDNKKEMLKFFYEKIRKYLEINDLPDSDSDD